MSEVFMFCGGVVVGAIGVLTAKVIWEALHPVYTRSCCVCRREYKAYGRKALTRLKEETGDKCPNCGHWLSPLPLGPYIPPMPR